MFIIGVRALSLRGVRTWGLVGSKVRVIAGHVISNIDIIRNRRAPYPNATFRLPNAAIKYALKQR